MTYHARIERADRLAACIEHLGLDDIVLEVILHKNMFRLTNTGIIFVYDVTGEVLITGYMATMKKTTMLYRSQGYERIPQNIYNRVVKINKRYKFLLEL